MFEKILDRLFELTLNWATYPNRWNPLNWMLVFVVAIVIVLMILANEFLLGWFFTPARRRKDWNKRQVFFF